MTQAGQNETGARAAAERAGQVLDIDHYVPGLLTFLANKLSRGASALYRRHFQIGINDWRIMSQLALDPWTTAAGVCAVIGIDKSVASRSLGLLERRGLVVAREEQRRRLMALTDEGRTLHDRIILVALERERRLLACLSEAERPVLVGMLQRLNRQLPEVNKRLDVPAAPVRGG